MPFAENLGTGGGALDAQYGSSPTANTNAPLLLDPRTSGNFVYTPGSAGNYVAVPHSPSLNILGTEGTPFLSLPGVSTQYATTPDEASLDVTGDLDVRMDLALDSWSTGGNAVPFSKGGASGWFWQLPASGQPQFAFLDNTANLRLFTASTAYPFTGNQRGSLRVTVELNVAGQCEVKFYTSTDFVTWTQLGTTQTGAFGVVSIAATTFPITIGGVNSSGDSRSAGKYYRMQIRNGIAGTTVFDADFTQQALGSRGFIESTGKLVSLVGDAAQIVDGTTYGFLPGVSSNRWTVPDASVSITGDIDIRVRVSLNSLTNLQYIVSKDLTAAPSSGYAMAVNADTLNFSWGNGGANINRNTANTLSAAGLVAGQTYWLRAQLDVDVGGTAAQVSFFWAPDSETEPTVWTAFVQPAAEGAPTAIADNAVELGIGEYHAGGSVAPMAGRVYRVIIRPNLTSGTKAFDADFTRQLQFASTFTEGSANLATVTTQGAARIERDRDIDLRVKVALDDWTPSSSSSVLSKWDDGEGRMFTLLVTTAGTLLLILASEQGTLIFPQSSAVVPATDGQAIWVRATLDVNNGSNGYTVTFYTSTDGTTWTTLGVPVVGAGAFSTQPVTTFVEVMSVNKNSSQFATGKVFNVEIRNGINGPAVLDIDFSDAITTGAETYLPDTVTEVIPEALQYLPNLGWGGTALNARFGSSVGADTNDPLLLKHEGTNYLYLPGSATNYGSSPAAAVLNPNGITLLRVEADVALDTWNRTGQMSLVHLGSDTYEFSSWDNGTLLFFWFDAALNYRAAVSTAAVPFAAGERGRVAVEITNAGVVTFFVSYDGVTWSQLGDPVPTGGTGFRNDQGPLFLGSYGNFSRFMSGKYYRATIKHAGVTRFDANFSTGITSGAQTTFTESSSNAATVTINRSTSGRKSVAVVQDVLLFGTDDSLFIGDNDLLDFNAGEDFTVMSAQRVWDTQNFQTPIAKKPGGGISLGWWLINDAASGNRRTYIEVGDGSTSAGSQVGSRTFGGMDVALATRAGASIQMEVGGVVGPAATANYDLRNAQFLYIGRAGGANFADMEFRGSAIWRRALTSTELALVNTHYTTGPTTASTALMQQAVFWIDAGTRSVAQINRSTSGRKSVACARCTWLLGTDDYFEVPASNLFDFAQGQDYTLLVLHRGWWAQGTNDTLLATSSSTTASAAGWAMSNSSGDPWQAGGRHGDGSNGVTAVAPRRDIGALSATWLVRDCDNDTLTAFTGSTSGTPVTDTTTGTIGNTNVMRLGRLSTTGTEYLDAEVVAAVVWRRRLTAAERNAVLTYYGV